MTEQTININPGDESDADKLAQEREQEPPEDINEGEQEAVEPTDEAAPEIDHADILRQAKLAHLVESYLPEGTDLETELSHVGGLEVGEDGTVTGAPVYRKPAVAVKSKKASTTKPNARTAPTPVDDWPTRRAKIRAEKDRMGL